MNFKEKLKTVKAFFFDLDGVLTDGSLLIMPGMEYVRRMNIKDGYALQLAVKKGFKVAIISGGKSEAVTQRLNRLGISDVFMGVSDKVEIFEKLLSQYKLREEDVLYMGDDMPDFGVMQKNIIRTCPADACPDIFSISDYVSNLAGGQGCARDVIEQVLRIQGMWYEKENQLVRNQ